MQIFTEVHFSFYNRILKLLKNHDVVELMVNGPGIIFLETPDRMIRLAPSAEVNDVANLGFIQQFSEAMAAAGKTEVTNGVFKGFAPDGSRLQIDIGRHILSGFSMCIRFKRSFMATWDAFKVKPEHKELIETTITKALGHIDENNETRAGKETNQPSITLENEKNPVILISGGTSSGKTTFINMLKDTFLSSLRLIVVEENQNEIELPNDLSVKMLVDPSGRSGSFGYPAAIDSGMRMRPDAFLMSELSIFNAYPSLRLMGTGNGMFFSTLHSDSPAGAVDAYLDNIVLAGHRVDRAATAESLLKRISLVIQLNRTTRYAEEGDKQQTHREVTEVISGKDLWSSYSNIFFKAA